jgi:hypothetical protein
MDRPNDQRRRRNHGRQDNDRHQNERQASGREGGRDSQRQSGEGRGDSGRGGRDNRDNRDNRGERDERGRHDAPRAERGSFSQYTREEKYPLPPVPPKREYQPDPVTGKPIDNIYTALMHRDSEQPVSFDTVIEQLRNAENLGERQQLIYIGSGQFGVYEEVEEGGKKRLQLVRRVVYEDGHRKPDWRRELSPGISRDYRPAPEPLDRLYSPEEERAFPKIGAASSAYMPRSS